MWVGISLILLPASGTLFFLVAALSSLTGRAIALSYYILLCCIWLMSLGVLLLSKGKKGVVDLGGESPKVYRSSDPEKRVVQESTRDSQLAQH